MTAATALVSIAVFAAALWACGLLRAGSSAVATARGALAVLRDPALDDDARERAVQVAALKLFAAFFSILLRSAAACLAAALPVILADFTGLASAEAVLAFLARADVILLSSLAMIAGYVLWRRWCPARPATPR